MYSKSKPQLVSNRMLKQLGKTFKVANVEQTMWTDSLGNFYADYIGPNLFALLVFAMLGIYLTIKYILKIDDTKKKAKIKRINKKIKYNTNLINNNNIQNEPVYDGSIYPEYMLKDELVKTSDPLYNLQKEYEYNLINNNEGLSEQMIKDAYQMRSSKYMFDAITKNISGT